MFIKYNLFADKKYLPERKHLNDAGGDVRTLKNVMLQPGTTEKLPLGFGIELPSGFAGFVMPRSSWAAKGLSFHLAPIDSGYTGEIHAIVTNTSNSFLQILEGERIGQLVIMPIVVAQFVDNLGEERGEGNFGSTGNA